MGKFSLYAVPLSTTGSDVIEYEYILDDQFFKLIEGTVDIRKGNLQAKLTVKHTAREFVLNFDIEGTVKVPCDRCLDDLEMPVNTKNKLIVKLGKEYSEESDEIVVIPEEESSINVAWFMFEFIALSLPMKHVHPTGMCNKAMTAKYNKHRTEIVKDDDLDDEDDVEELDNDSFETDSRWDALKNLNVED